MQVDLNKYAQFLEGVTSPESGDTECFIASIKALQEARPDINVALVITAAVGMSGESGEFSELFKKVVFHRKPFTDELKAHAAKELGDIFWYWANACRALGLDPNQVIVDNVSKLESRYPGGVFSVEAAENRKPGDI